MGWFSDITDSISHAIGTDGSGTTPLDTVSAILGTNGSNSGLLPGLSNALGTDGSKNGLLNDPYSMAALAIGGGAYMGWIPVGGSAATGGVVSSGAGAAVADAGFSVAAGDAAFSSAMAGASSASAASAASSSWTLPAWLTPSNVLSGASMATKLFGGSAPQRSAAQPMYGMPMYFGGAQPMQAGNPAAARPRQAAAPAAPVSPLMGLLLAAGIFYLVKK